MGAPVAEANSIDQIAGKVQLDPASLKLLEQQSELNGVNFEQVLAATEKGQDPEAVIELLKSGKQQQIVPGNPQKISQEQVGTEIAPNRVNKQNTLGQELNQKQNVQVNPFTGKEVVTKEPKSIFVNPKKQQIQAEVAKETTRKSIFDIPGRKKPAYQQQNGVKNNQLAQMKMHQPVMQTQLKQPLAQVQTTQAQMAQNSSGQNLVNLNQFMANQSPSAQKMVKKQLIKNAYRPLTKSMFEQKLNDSLPAVATSPSVKGETTLQDIMFQNSSSSGFEQNMNQGQNLQGMIQANELQGMNREMAPQKVFNLSEIQPVETHNELLHKVQDYIVQTRLGQKPEVQMAFHHQDLGQVDLIVNKVNDNINVAINTHQVSGQEFFRQNQSELVKSLQQSGIQLGEFKIDFPMTITQNNSMNSSTQDFGSKSQQQEFGDFQQNRGQHNSQSGQRDQESRRREELWQLFQDKEVA